MRERRKIRQNLKGTLSFCLTALWGLSCSPSRAQSPCPSTDIRLVAPGSIVTCNAAIEPQVHGELSYRWYLAEALGMPRKGLSGNSDDVMLVPEDGGGKVLSCDAVVGHERMETIFRGSPMHISESIAPLQPQSLSEILSGLKPVNDRASIK
ncbi:MAG: hypothetical protein EOP06_00865 [Proteobacteria bacterium]|nr:MAG: hypothetical protein EOP06_00865 [Pseudomonadota bacterium]